jgi:hypothetical protein
LSRDEVRYLLDPADVMGPDYPSETFRVLKQTEERLFGEYRTRRLVIAAYDALVAGAPLASETSETADLLQGPPPARPRVDPTSDASLALVALLWAAGGTIEPNVLARAFALRNQPSLILGFVPPSLVPSATAWAAESGSQAVPTVTARTALNELEDRNAIQWLTGDAAPARIATTRHTPAESQLDPWFRFEARLLLAVLDAVNTADTTKFDVGVAGEDRTLLHARLA